MIYFAQINTGANPVTQLGVAYIVFGLIYLILWVFWLNKNANRIDISIFLFHLIKIIIGTTAFEAYGLIMIYHGWRLDPYLQLSQFLLSLIVAYLILKDIVITIIYKIKK